MTKFYVTLMSFVSDIEGRKREEKGATAVEYGLLVALIAAIIVGVVATLGTQVAAGFQTVVDALPGGGA